MGVILWESSPKARIHHTCECCGRPIDPGETYRRTRILGDDGPYTWKQCAHCEAFVRHYIDEICPDLWDGYTQEDIAEWEPATPEAAEHKRQWAVRWRRHAQDLYPVPEFAR